MRVYTNQIIRNLWAYVSLIAMIAVLFMLVSYAMKIWSDEPAVQQLQELKEDVQSE